MSEIQVIARYRVAAGNEREVRGLLPTLTVATEAEPGNVSFRAYVQLDDERDVILLERYASAEALAGHRETEHFKELVLERIVPLLDSRIVETYDVGEA